MVISVSLCIPHSELSIDDLKRITTVTDLQIDRRLQEPDLPPLAAYFDNINEDTEDYVEKLGLSPGQQTDVKTKAFLKGTGAGMRVALKHWRNRNPVGATFRALLLILLSRGEARVAARVCQCELVDFSSFVSVLSSTILRYSRH